MTPPGDFHPTELLPWLVNGTLEGDELRRVEEHLRSCLACRREVDELRELREEVKITSGASPPGAEGLERLLAELPPEAPSRSLPTHPGWFRRWAPLAVAAVLMVAVGIVLQAPDERQPPVERAGEEEAVLRSLVGEGALPREAFVLRWRPAPAWRQARFSVTVTDEGLASVLAVARDLEVPEFQVPADKLAAVPPGAWLRWRVEAVRRSDGARHAAQFKVRVE